MPRYCPDCRETMREEFHCGVHLDACAYCAGVWFDQGELGRLQNEGLAELGAIDESHLPEVIPKPDAKSRRACPECLEPLRPFHYLLTSPIELDSCPRCLGVWVEDGELQKIEEWREGHAPLTAGQEHARGEAAVAGAELDSKLAEDRSRSNAIANVCRMLVYRPLWGARWV